MENVIDRTQRVIKDHHCPFLRATTPVTRQDHYFCHEQKPSHVRALALVVVVDFTLHGQNPRIPDESLLTKI